MSDELLDQVNASLDRLVASIRDEGGEQAHDYNEWIALMADRPDDDHEARALWMPRAVTTTTIIWDLFDHDAIDGDDSDDSDDDFVQPDLDEDILEQLRTVTDSVVADVRAAIAAHPSETQAAYERVQERPTPAPDDEPDFENLPAPTGREPHMVDSLIVTLDRTGRDSGSSEA